MLPHPPPGPRRPRPAAPRTIGPSRRALPAGLSTPLGWLRLALGAILALVLLFFLAAFHGIESHRLAMKVIGKDSAPSIVASQHIKADLADMHANVANILLGEPGKSPQAVKSYADRRQELTTSLIEAAENISYEEPERASLRQPLEPALPV